MCRTSSLTYQNFGEPFMANWCNGCHSSGLPSGMRQLAPADVNFDTLAEIRAQSVAILVTTVTDVTMPPEGGPSDDERALLSQWMDCGAR